MRQKYKIGIMATLVVGACVLVYCFRVFLGVGTFVNHIFYIPIILAAVWWEKRGLIVPAFLSAFLILIHILYLSIR